MNITKSLDIEGYYSEFNWRPLFVELIPFIGDVDVRLYFSEQILQEGSSPGLIAQIPKKIFDADSQLHIKAKDQILKYSLFFEKEIEKFKAELQESALI